MVVEEAGREEDVQARPFFEGHDPVGDLVHGVLFHFGATVGAEGATYTCEEQTKVVVDLRGRGDGGAGVAGLVLLADGYGGGDAVDDVHIGLLDTLQELARVRGERFDVAALSLGINGVEGQRGLPGTRDSGHNGEGVVLDLKVDILKIVDACAADCDRFGGHSPSGPPQRGSRLSGDKPPQSASKTAAESFYYKLPASVGSNVTSRAVGRFQRLKPV